MDQHELRIQALESGQRADRRQSSHEFKLIMGALAVQRDATRGLRDDLRELDDFFRKTMGKLDRRFELMDRTYQRLFEQLNYNPDAPDPDDHDEIIQQILARLERLENPPAA